MGTEVKSAVSSDLGHVQMTTENLTKPFKAWAVDSAQFFFPEVGTRTVRAPALYFNHQNHLTPEQALKKKLISEPGASRLQRLSPASSSVSSSPSFSSSSSSSSASSSTATSPSPFIPPAMRSEDVAMRHQDVAAESGERASHITDGEVIQDRSSFQHPREKSTLLIQEWNSHDYSENHPAGSASHGQEFLSTLTGLSETSQSGHVSEPRLTNTGVLSDTAQVMDIMDHAKNKHSSHTNTTMEAGDQTTNNRPSTDQLQVQNPSPKRRGKRRRNGNAKQAKNSPVTPTDAGLEAPPLVNTHRHQHPNLSVSIFKEPVLSDSDDEEEPYEKKERPTDPSHPSTNQLQLNTSSAQSSEHHSRPPTSFKKSTQKLKSRHTRSPNSHTQPVQVVFPPQESMQRRDKAMSIVLDFFQAMGRALEEDGEEGLFIISGINYDHYLCRLPASLLAEMGRGYLGDSPTSRGIVDIMILQGNAGIVLVQVKSVGGNLKDWKADETDTARAVKMVAERVHMRSQNLRREIWHELIGERASDSADADGRGGGGGGCTGVGSTGRELKDLQDSSPLPASAARAVHHVLALPFVPRAVYNKVLEDCGQSVRSSSSSSSSSSSNNSSSSNSSRSSLSQMQVLCKEDFEGNTSSLTLPMELGETTLPLSDGPPWCGSVPSVSRGAVRSLLRWWRDSFLHPTPRLTPEKLKEVVGRICGPFSTLAAQPDTKCRSEVRTYGHCISETATRYGAPCLTVPQFELLGSEDPHVALCAPPGSGKTLLLTLKALQWLEQENSGHEHVVVASLGRQGATPPRDLLLQNAIYSRRTASRKSGKLLHAVFPVDDMLSEDVELEVADVADSLVNCVRHARSSRSSERNVDAVDIESKRRVEEDPDLDTFHFIVNEVDPNEENTLLVLRALCRHPRVRSVWWSTTEPPRSPETTSLFRVETLSHVTRRSPHVQQVMKAVEWRGEWRGMYAADSVESALPTEGPPVIWIQHWNHRQERPEDCHISEIPFPNHCDVAQTNFDHTSTPAPPQTIMTRNDARNPSYNHLQQTVREQAMDLDQGWVRDELDAKEPVPTNHHYQCKDHAGKSHSLGLSDYSTFEDDGTQHILSPRTVSVDYDAETSIPQSVDKKGQHSGLCHSPFWCERCAEAIADAISQVIIDSVNPNVSSFLVGSTKLLKEPSKNRFGEPVKPRDILIVTDSMSQNTGECKSQSEGKSRLEDLAHSTLVLRVQEVVPVKVLTEGSSHRIAFPSNSAVLTDLSCARGLERKMVVYVPGNTGEAPACTENPHNITSPKSDVHIMNGHISRAAASLGITKEGTCYSHTVNGHSESEESQASGEDNSLSSVSSQSAWSCPACEEAGRQATVEQGFILCEQDSNWNTLVRVEQQKQPDVRPESNDEPQASDDRSVKAGYLREGRCSRQNESWDGEIHLGEGRAYHTTARRETADICEPCTVNTLHGGSQNRENQNLCVPNEEPNHKEETDDESNDRDSTGSTSSTVRISPSQPLQQKQHQQQQGTTHSAKSPPSGKQQLPRWIQDKKRLIQARDRRKRTPQGAPARSHCKKIQGAPVSTQSEEGHGSCQGCSFRDLGSALRGLSDVNRRGMFAAAACCLAQLVIIIP